MTFNELDGMTRCRHAEILGHEAKGVSENNNQGFKSIDEEGYVLLLSSNADKMLG